METLNKYVGITLIKSMLLVLFVFIGLEIFILLATQIGSIGKGSYTLWQALIYVFMILPQETYLLFPMAGLVGLLFGLNILSHHSELVAMRAAGVSPMQIVRASLQAGFILIMVMTLIGEGIGPSAKSSAENRKLIQSSTEKVLETKEGLWLRQDQNFYYIKTIYSKKHIADVTRYQFDHGVLTSVSLAKEGYYHHDAEEDNWEMHDIKQSQIFPQQVTASMIPTATWDLAIDPQLLRISRSLPQEMSLKELFNFIQYQRENHLSDNANEIVFWQRILQPIACLIIMFLAVPFIFGSLRTTTRSLRLLLGLGVGFVFYLLNQLFPPLSQVMNFSPFIAAILPVCIFGMIGILLLKKMTI